MLCLCGRHVGTTGADADPNRNRDVTTDRVGRLPADDRHRNRTRSPIPLQRGVAHCVNPLTEREVERCDVGRTCHRGRDGEIFSWELLCPLSAHDEGPCPPRDKAAEPEQGYDDQSDYGTEEEELPQFLSLSLSGHGRLEPVDDIEKTIAFMAGGSYWPNASPSSFDCAACGWEECGTASKRCRRSPKHILCSGTSVVKGGPGKGS